ncbi:hypothetical protein [Nonomuraea roseoviolacea]|uniref:Uncharacterized protein YjbJ (UPF0337 family) n=1 Tax=Nonomuraea roseoviolacea subsp. carminata TaxID=160689 RepID=A0ABT1K9L0_9ACTN|nr:hypothetical protein [Nonomuraea roseoviolacea]MCP2350685.1 uncharacterized protein YjbJ (UPF0337 family) [Nonomuraea roseoviolacea subsp. carminata]
MSPTRKIRAKARVIKGWIMVYFGRATGNQQLESEGMVVVDGKGGDHPVAGT